MSEVQQLIHLATERAATASRPLRPAPTSHTAARESADLHPSTSAATPSTRVSVYAKDAILRAGVIAELRCSPLVALADSPGLDPEAVAVIVTDDIHEDVLAAIRAIRRSCTPRIVVIASRLTRTGASASVEAGASRFLLRANARPDRLVAAVRSAAVAPRPPAALEEALGDVAEQLEADPPAPPERPAGLSDRDVEVLRLMAAGESTASIARDLAYSESTIKNVIHAIVHELGARNRAHAVAMALRAELI